MKNKRMFVVKFLASSSGSIRFRITDTRREGKSKIYSWDYKLNGLLDQASAIFKNLNIEISGYSQPWTEDDKLYLFSNDFSTRLK
jgi:hypothetical protein|tara:strand:- start:1424 stop:1678 length:255 start_codon:yes stop_codon:yes gene_type:complete